MLRVIPLGLALLYRYYPLTWRILWLTFYYCYCSCFFIFICILPRKNAILYPLLFFFQEYKFTYLLTLNLSCVPAFKFQSHWPGNWLSALSGFSLIFFVFLIWLLRCGLEAPIQTFIILATVTTVRFWGRFQSTKSVLVLGWFSFVVEVLVLSVPSFGIWFSV